ncbi:uncharacterized protein LOC122505160 [Leptopilina heterotoma]|uniref:uncharacterized protein LOC122505160 n=1 Tax=Leptopilina heterotoma TaxID=63436 RepID=UPI001CA7C76C|nr:uncharacterized protein LOC122505160 [Leptopilina heterotoma]XP_043472573.1 uncharacterized protein LOC122505160 [Leptopilina heterotoma]XP_043472574.1 uncharacterized protein LOC122505160 [Leptopilina heterotoma]
MKNKLRNIYFLLSLAACFAVIMESKSDHSNLDTNESNSFSENIGVCFSKKLYTTMECINRGALISLQTINEKDDLNFGDMRFERSEGQSRDLLDLDYDPKDFGNVIEAASRLMERRNFQWDMGNFYPGLQMRVGPTLNANGVLEFVLDERVSKLNNRQAGSGRTLMKHVLLPFLLGFKFNLISLIPLVFGILLFVTKKALILTKIALILTGLLGWNNIFSGPVGPTPPINFNGFGYGNGYGLDTTVDDYPYHEHQVPYRPFAGQNPGITPYAHVIREVVNVYDAETDAERSDASSRNGKNFVWSKE